MLTNMKKKLGLLLAVATLSAVTALVPSTAGAAPSVVPNAGTVTDPQTAPSTQETFKACPAGSASAAGFTDTTSTDVDCIKMFGITQGKDATTYDPSGTISRQDMARFIHRMFVPAGVAAAGATAVPAFTDIAHVSADGVAAINALASHGITLGTGDGTTYSPDSNVTREQMAIFLNRFASIAKDHAGAAITAIAAASGIYNYSDIASTSWEGMESIIRLFNLGVTEGNCVAAACGSTYRPSEDITRAEMATMLTNLLNHTNARPAGVTMQTPEGFVTAGSKTTLISVRKADFSPSINAQVDHFYDPTQLTTARALAANAPFTAVLNTVSASVTSAAGTAGTIDPLDPTTNTYGNVAGATLTTAVNSTTTWWAWTDTAGTVYIDGTTAGVAKLEAVMGAASTTVYADTTTVTISGSNALGYALPEDLSGAHTSAIADDGIKTMAGASRTITATMSNSALTTAGTAHTVVDGYTFKFSHLKVDMLGNVSITNTYVPSSNGAASYVVTCGADNSATVNGDGTAGGSYWEVHEVTITEATALGSGAGISRPTAASTASTATYTLPTDGGDSASANISCDDEARAYTAGTTGNTLSVSTNNATVSTAGTLVAVTTTAYDQYGDGIAGVTSRIDKGGVQQAVLTSQANGVSTLNTVLCTANGTAAFSVNTTGATMSNITATTPTNLIEGTTVYCATAGGDVSYGPATNARESQTMTFSNAADAGNLVCTYTNPTSGVAATTAVIAHDGNAGAWTTAFNDLSNLAGAAVTLSGAGAEVATLQFADNTGDHAAVTCDGTTGTALAASGAATTLTVATSVAGVNQTTLDFVDDDPTANTFVTVRTVQQPTAAGAAETATTYHIWDWDSTDVFMLDATHAQVTTTVSGASEAQWEAELKSLTDQTVNMTLSERDGALTTGISVFQIGK